LKYLIRVKSLVLKKGSKDEKTPKARTSVQAIGIKN